MHNPYSEGTSSLAYFELLLPFFSSVNVQMASQIASARDIPIAEQHEFIDLAKEFKWDEVKRRINANSALVNVRPAMRWSALHQAAYSGDAGAVRFLLEHDAAIDAKTSEGETPIDVAKTTAVKRILNDFTGSGKVPTPLRAGAACVAHSAAGSVKLAKTAKLTKSMKVMKSKKVMKVKKRTVARGKRGKALVYKGKFVKTSGGLTKDHLTKSKNGKIVSKRRQAHGKKSYANIQKWVKAFLDARAQMGITGFVALKKGSALYEKAKTLYQQ
jgi:hypothetical protein